MLIGNRSTPVMRTGFTAARNECNAADPVPKPNSSRRLNSSTDAILLNGIFVQVQPESRKIGQVNIAVLDTEDVGRAQEFQSRRPLLLGKIGAADDLLPLAIGHRAARLDVSGQRQR